MRVGIVLRLTRKQAGFTLVETLVAMLIMLIAMLMVTNGVTLAHAAYVKTVDGANAQVVLSTAAMLLRDELDKATEIEPSANGKELTYRSAKTGFVTTLSTTDDVGVCLTTASDAARPLVGEVAGDGLLVTYDQVTYGNGLFTVTGLKVSKRGYGVLAELESDTPLVFRAIVSLEE